MSEDFQLFLEDLLTYLNCQEADMTQLRMQINKYSANLSLLNR